MDRKQVFLDFYKIMREEEVSWLNLHSEHSKTYITLISAILTALIAAFYLINQNLVMILIIMGCILNISLSFMAIKMCDRFYRRFLETVTILAKIEPLLGLTNDREAKAAKVNDLVFPEDKHYLPSRWIESRDRYKTSHDFVEQNMNEGSNKWLHRFFKALLWGNLLMILMVFLFRGEEIIDIFCIKLCR